MNTDLHFSSARQDWATPWDFYLTLDNEFHFTLDPCCTIESAKCPKFYTKEDNGLIQDWSGERVFMNPPYGDEIGRWIHKASISNAILVVCLLPARTDTAWFHDYILTCSEIRFIRGRLKFDGHSNSAPFPSLLAIFR